MAFQSTTSLSSAAFDGKSFSFPGFQGKCCFFGLAIFLFLFCILSRLLNLIAPKYRAPLIFQVSIFGPLSPVSLLSPHFVSSAFSVLLMISI